MLTEQERKSFLDTQDALRKRVSQLREELNQLGELKEHLFTEKEKIHEQIGKIISDARTQRNQRDSFTGEVKELKQKRDELNTQIKQKIEEFKRLSQQKRDMDKQHNVRGDPAQLKEEIEKLEYKVETEPMSFDKEKEVMLKIKALRQRYKESEGLSTFYDKVYAVSKEIEELKRKADGVHRKIQSIAKESQEKHEHSVELGGEIDVLRKKEQDLFDKFTDSKTKFNELHHELKKALSELGTISEKLKSHHTERIHAKQKKAQEELRQMEQEIEEKVKKKKKLTTEDLLVFQQSVSNEK